jgi:hypothetical protein
MDKATLLLSIALAQTPQAQLDCRATGKDFTYDCTVMLMRGGRPLEGAEVTVGADMPSMPMAHQVKPAKASAGPRPGEYKVRLELEMLGEWAVKLRLAGPVRDQIVVNYDFDSKGAKPSMGGPKMDKMKH